MVTPYVMVVPHLHHHQRFGIPKGSLTGRSAHPSARARCVVVMGFFTDQLNGIVPPPLPTPIRLVPPVDGHPGAAALGVVDYIDGLLDAFAVDPPRIWAGGPYSGRAGGDAEFGHFLELSPLEALAWRTRIEGSLGIPERERLTDPSSGGRTTTARAWPRSVPISPASTPTSRTPASTRSPTSGSSSTSTSSRARYAAPEYRGNRDLGGWTAIGFPGDVQPRGYTDEEVEGRGERRRT